MENFKQEKPRQDLVRWAYFIHALSAFHILYGVALIVTAAVCPMDTDKTTWTFQWISALVAVPMPLFSIFAALRMKIGSAIASAFFYAIEFVWFALFIVLIWVVCTNDVGDSVCNTLYSAGGMLLSFTLFIATTTFGSSLYQYHRMQE